MATESADQLREKKKKKKREREIKEGERERVKNNKANAFTTYR